MLALDETSDRSVDRIIKTDPIRSLTWAGLIRQETSTKGGRSDTVLCETFEVRTINDLLSNPVYGGHLQSWIVAIPRTVPVKIYKNRRGNRIVNVGCPGLGLR